MDSDIHKGMADIPWSIKFVGLEASLVVFGPCRIANVP